MNATAQRSLLVEQHLPLVRSLARRMAPSAYPFLELGDLVSIGTEALLRASERYDTSRSVPFGSFVYLRVRGAMVEGLGTQGPHSRGRRRRRTGRGERRPLPVLCAYNDAHHRSATAEPATALADAIDDRRRGRFIAAAMAALDDRSRELVRRHYFDGEPLLDIARDMGISKSWASRTHARALERLRDALEQAMAGHR
jgi:RNA polymerase sigma factor for flagellar operon FliA